MRWGISDVEDLRYFYKNNFTNSEIAEKFGITNNAVKQQLKNEITKRRL